MIAGIGLGLAGLIMGGTFEGISVPFHYRGISDISENITGSQCRCRRHPPDQSGYEGWKV